MITTTVIWTADSVSQSDSQQLADMASTIWPDGTSVLPKESANEGYQLVAPRTWPDIATAQRWIDYVSANFEIISAVVNPET